MSELAALQRDFSRYVLGESDAARALVADSGRAGAEERMGVYREAYALRLIEALATDYTALGALLGARDFEAAARAYIRAHPSRHPSVRWFGASLADFLARSAPWSAEPWLAELARFEWTLSLCLDAADAPLLTVADMAAVAPERWPVLRLGLHPSVQRIDLHWNAPQLWKALEAGEPVPAPERTEPSSAWLAWRAGLASRYRSLGADEAWALDAAAAGADFSALCEGLCEWIDAAHVAMHAAGLLKGWISDGLVREVRCD